MYLPFIEQPMEFLQSKQCLGSGPNRLPHFDLNNDDGLRSTAGIWCDLCLCIICIHYDLHSGYIGPKARFKDADLQLELDLVYLTDRVGLSHGLLDDYESSRSAL